MEDPLGDLSSDSLMSSPKSLIDTISVMEEELERSDTPLNDTINSVSTDTEKGIVVDAPPMIDSSALMLDPEEEDDEDDGGVEVLPLVKRKRPSVNYILDDGDDKTSRESPASERPVKRSKLTQKIRGVIIGVWRDSDQPIDDDKHVIFGFIDIHDRLRTRIYGMNRRGEEVLATPTGAGSCWVTFERIIFDAHLRGLSSIEIKEYVKIRSGIKPEATAEERAETDAKVVLRAKAIVAQQEAASPKPIVHRNPSGRQSLGNGRVSTPRQPVQQKTNGFQAVNAIETYTSKNSPYNDIKPQGVLIGYWADSDQPLEADKHAVFGVLSGSDSFRVKVQKVTRDGRFVDGNFPPGAGGIWLHFEKAVLEPHLAELSRAEVKEYCRIRYQDLEQRESEKERKANELKAVEKARSIIAESMNNSVEQEPTPEIELRHSVRSEHRTLSRQQAAIDDAAASKAQKQRDEARERQLEQTRREVAAAEAALKGPAAEDPVQLELKKNMAKLNKVWIAQKAATTSGIMTPAGQLDEEVKFHNGIRYERKHTGPFQGKLVSPAQILIIDGEDFVEYRILTRPM